jgi:hypothetical protein
MAYECMTAADYRAWHDDDDAFCEWMEGMPVGTFVSLESLERLRWPIDPADHSGWLIVACAQHMDLEAYQDWLLRLPAVGVVADPADARFRCILTNKAGWR